MLSIYKYELQLTDVQELQLPRGAKILKVDYQYDKLQLWAVVNSNQLSETCVIAIVGTGPTLLDDFLSNYTYLNSVMSGPYVWHIFYGLKDQLSVKTTVTV